jgi:hypothetical protein
MANAHALEEDCRPIVEEMIRKGGAKAIAVASSYGDGSERSFLDSPKAEWLWEFAAANDVVVHIHPPMLIRVNTFPALRLQAPSICRQK